MTATTTQVDGTKTGRRLRPWVRALLAVLGLAAVGLVALAVVGYRHPLAAVEVLGRIALRSAGLERATVAGPTPRCSARSSGPTAGSTRRRAPSCRSPAL